MWYLGRGREMWAENGSVLPCWVSKLPEEKSDVFGCRATSFRGRSASGITGCVEDEDTYQPPAELGLLDMYYTSLATAEPRAKE
jgi:hypothetical protein